MRARKSSKSSSTATSRTGSLQDDAPRRSSHRSSLGRPPTPTRPSTSSLAQVLPGPIDLGTKPSTAGSRSRHGNTDSDAGSGDTVQSGALGPMEAPDTDRSSTAFVSPKSMYERSVNESSEETKTSTTEPSTKESTVTTQGEPDGSSQGQATAGESVVTEATVTTTGTTSGATATTATTTTASTVSATATTASTESTKQATQATQKPLPCSIVPIMHEGQAIPPFICPITGEALKVYCHEEGMIDCLICPTQRHQGHRVELLRDFCATQKAILKTSKHSVQHLISELTALEMDTPQRASRLHLQVDEAIDNLVDALNRRRRALHDDIRNRSTILISDLGGELSARKQELQRLESAKLTLTLLSNGRGVAPEGAIGDLLRGTMCYDEFLAIGDPEMPPAPTIKQLLNVSIPLKMREEILRFGWTPETRDDNPLVYPPKGF